MCSEGLGVLGLDGQAGAHGVARYKQCDRSSWSVRTTDGGLDGEANGVPADVIARDGAGGANYSVEDN